MSRWFAALSLLLAFALLLAPQTARADEPHVVQVMAKVQRFYDGVKTYRAHFKQVFRLAANGNKQVRTGIVSFARKSKMSFRYAAPNEGRVVSNGKEIRIWSKRDKTMYVSKLERSPYSAVLTLLEGKGRLMRAFELRLVDPKRKHIKSGRVLEAIPREATPAYEKLLLYVDEDSGRVDRILILDAQGNSNRFELHKAVINGKLPSREFRFSPPAGTKVIKP